VIMNNIFFLLMLVFGAYQLNDDTRRKSLPVY